MANEEGLLRKQVMPLEQADQGEMTVKNNRLRIEGGGKEVERQKLSVTTRQSIWETAKTSVCYQRACFQRRHLKPHSIKDGLCRQITLRKTASQTPSRKDNEANGMANLFRRKSAEGSF